MANEKVQTIRISRDGAMRGLQTPLVDALADKLGGTKDVARASHVDVGRDLTQEALSKLVPDFAQLDPDYAAIAGSVDDLPQAVRDAGLVIKPEYANKWFADMSPVGGPVLGPLEGSREDALAAEEQWLRENGIPLPKKIE